MEGCAYQHKKSHNINKIDMLEEEVINLKNHIKEIDKDKDTKKIAVLENSLKVLQQQVNWLEIELRASHRKLEVDTSCERSDPMKDVTMQDTQNCSDFDYKCENKIGLIKHFNTKHRKSLKCCQCSEMFRDNDALDDHMMKDYSKEQNAPGNGKSNVKCDKCDSKFTSKMALSQHMFTTHTPTRIEETGIYCNLCGDEFWTELA